MTEIIPITIIGGGVVGCAIAYELSQHTDQQILLVDRNPNFPGENQSSRNSGVIHAGIYYRRENAPLKAQLCVAGNRELYRFCEEFDIPHMRTGKLIVATNKDEEDYLKGTLKIAQENGVSDIKKISGIEAKLLEPSINVTSALLVLSSGIVEPTALTRKLKSLADDRGAYFLPNNIVIDIKPKNRGFIITVQSGDAIETFETDVLINSAGLYSDEIVRLVNPDSSYEILPIRYESSKFSKNSSGFRNMCNMNLYPTPRALDPVTKTVLNIPYSEFVKLYREGKVSSYVGVHLTPTLDYVDGQWRIGDIVTIGPAATSSKSKTDIGDSSITSGEFARKINSFFPNIDARSIMPHQTGIMAKLKGGNDFVIERDSRYPDCINLVGIDSPGLTASLAIAKYVREMLKD